MKSVFNTEINIESFRKSVENDSDTINEGLYENLIQNQQEEDLGLERISELTAAMIEIEEDDISNNLAVIEELDSILDLNNSYPKEIISTDFLAKLFILIATDELVYYIPTFKLLRKIIGIFFTSDIYELFPDETLEMFLGLCDDPNLATYYKIPAFETVMDVFISSYRAISQGYPYIEHMFMIAKALGSERIQSRFVDYILTCSKISGIEEVVVDQLFADMIKEMCGWSVKTRTLSSIAINFFDKKVELIRVLFDDDDMYSYVQRMFNSDEKGDIISILPFVQYIIGKDNIFSLSMIDEMFSKISLMWTQITDSKIIWKFTEFATERIDEIVAILAKYQFTSSVALLFDSEAPINGDTKIFAATALCHYVVKATEEQLEAVDCEQINDVLDSVEGMDAVDQSLYEEACFKLHPDESD